MSGYHCIITPSSAVVTGCCGVWTGYVFRLLSHIHLSDEIELFAVCIVGMRVFVHGGAATPLTLLNALAKHGVNAKLKDVELIHIHTEGPGICVQPEYDGKILRDLASVSNQSTMVRY